TLDRDGRLGRPTRRPTLAGAPHRRALKESLAASSSVSVAAGFDGADPPATLTRCVPLVKRERKSVVAP
ncbi:MAG: hypothetical protein ACXVHJ_29765, partial [Solirubrobacteraceae bacterium]